MTTTTTHPLKNRKRALPAPVFDFRKEPIPRTVRPARYSEQMAVKICERLMMKESLEKICADPRYPSVRTVTRWLADPKMVDFREMYYHARRIQAEMRVDEIFEIADNSSNDWEPVYNKDGDVIDYKPNNEAIQRSRVRIDTRKWYASKMVPRIYGEKIEHDLDVTGDLAELLKSASNRDSGLPPPIDGELAK